MTIGHFSLQINQKNTPTTKSQATQIVQKTFELIRKQFTKQEMNTFASDTGFIRRSSAKISGFDFLLSLLASSQDPSHCSLERLTELLNRVNRKVNVSAQALMSKINTKEAVEFLKVVLAKTLAARIINLTEDSIPSINSFRKVLIQDSSVIQLHSKLQAHFKGSGGRASSAFAKLDVIYDYKAKEFERIKLTDQGEADQKLSLDIDDYLVEDSLVIRDLGYLNGNSLNRVVSKKAFFLSRLRLDFKIYLSKESRVEINIEKCFHSHFSKDGILDLEVFLGEKRIAVRLIASRAPEEVANQRRRQAKRTAKKQGRNLREKTLKLMGLTLFITNVPKDIWEAKVVHKIYKLRWQIELIFKGWKSRLGLSFLKGINHHRINCLIYAKLILILITSQIYKLVELIGKNLFGREVSLPKVLEWVRDRERLIGLLKGFRTDWERRFFLQNVFRSMCMQSRKRKTTLRSLQEKDFAY